MKKIIIHLDLDAFFASVEEIKNPKLKNFPLVVGHFMNGKGIVTTANYKARKYGIHSSMPIFKAKTLCKDLVIVEPSYDEYTEWSEKVFLIVNKLVDQLEMTSIDEGYADITKTIYEKNLDPLNYSRYIQREILRKTGLGISIGVSNNRIMSKMASGFSKPLGVDTLWENELQYKLWALPVGKLWYVGTSTEKKLVSMGIKTIRDLAMIKPETERWIEMISIFGKNFKMIWGFANGISSDEINTHSTIIKSINRGQTFHKYTDDYEFIKKQLKELSLDVSNALKYRGLIAKKIEFGYKSAISDLGPKVAAKKNYVNLDFATNKFEIIFSSVLSVYEKKIKQNEVLKYVGVTASLLTDEYYSVEQLDIWSLDDVKKEISNSKRIIKELNSIIGYKAFVDGNAIGQYKKFIDKTMVNADSIKFKRWER